MFNRCSIFTRIVITMGLFPLLSGCASTPPTHSLSADDSKSWYKGNTHTHTLWSDGDAAPELAVAWYKEHGYDFLSLTDHNTLSRGVKDVLISDDPKSKLTVERVEILKKEFGADTVKIIEKDGQSFMRLRTLDELRSQFDEPGKFLLIEGEEITGKTHVNGINLSKVLAPSESKDKETSLREQVGSLHAHRDEMGVPMFAHLNHPNWSTGISAEEIARVSEARYFEIFNGGGPTIRHWGYEKEGKPTMAKKWDVILTHRLSENKDHTLYGVGTDDTHDYFGTGESPPGRGWIVVLADELSPNGIVEAILAGDFYSSNGVMLDSISWDSKRFAVASEPEAGVTFTTQFMGTRKGYDSASHYLIGADGKEMRHRTKVYSDDVGEVLYETTDNPAVYHFDGDEIYVRAKVTSSKLQEDPSDVGDHEMAWTQPVVPE